MAGEEERAFERLSGLSKSGRSSTDRGALGSIFQSAVGIEEEWWARFWACTLSRIVLVHKVLEHKVLVHIGVLTCFCTFSFICSGHGVHSSSATSPGGTC